MLDDNGVFLVRVGGSKSQIRKEGDLDNRRHTQVTDNLSRIALQPVMPARHLPNLDVTGSLSRNPKSLYVLWDEWERGIGGRKPEKEFTS